MLNWKRPALMALAGATFAAAQPALTTVQDTLYRADGSRFTGTMYITWSSFQGGDTSNIATANLTLPIVNGALRVRLVPTTTASPGARYNVRYNSRGVNDFTEVWAVPPSTVNVRVRDVRVFTGVVVGPPPVTTPVQIPDVVGLQNELAVRPQKGVGFGIGRTAVINTAGQIDAAAGNLGDCVRVDGSAGPCGGGGGGGVYPGFADGEIPLGAINGVNLVFTLAFAPSPASSLLLFRNGVLMRQGADYAVTGNTATFFLNSVPMTGDLLVASYRYANPSNPLGTLTPAQVVCSSVGASVSTTTSTSLGTCTLPGGFLGAGDRITVEYHFGHSGAAVGFTGEVRIGTVTVLLRSAGSTEFLLTGRSGFSIDSTGQLWDTESWGSGTALAVAGGTSSQDHTQPLTIDLRGQMAASGTDAVVLRNFTVVRHPAQANP